MYSVQVDDLAPMHDDRDAASDQHTRDELALDVIRLDDRMVRVSELLDEIRTDKADGKNIGFRLAELSCYVSVMRRITQSIAARI